MTLQELQLAIRAYRATVVTEDQANEFQAMLSEEAGVAEELACQHAEFNNEFELAN